MAGGTPPPLCGSTEGVAIRITANPQFRLRVVKFTLSLSSQNAQGGDHMVLRAILVGSVIGVAVLGGAATANAEPFANCTAAREAGYEDIPSSSPYYGPWLDRDNDGIGCES